MAEGINTLLLTRPTRTITPHSDGARLKKSGRWSSLEPLTHEAVCSRISAMARAVGISATGVSRAGDVLS